MLTAVQSASAMHMASSVLQRLSALALTVMIGQGHSLERMGEWFIAQTLALAVQGPVGMALAQHLIADGSAPDAPRRRHFLEAVKLATMATALAFGLVHLLLASGALPAAWVVLGPGALASVWLYATGGAVYLLVSAWLLVEGDAARLRRLVAVGMAAVALPAPFVCGPHLWAGVAIAGAVLGAGAMLSAGLSGADLRAAWQARMGAVFGRVLPLALGNAMVNPALFVSVYVVGVLGGASAAAVYGIGNQVRNLLMLPASLVLPLHLRARAGGRRSRAAPVTLWCAALVLLPCMAWPGLVFRIFSAQATTPEIDSVVRLALASVPLALLAAFAGQTLIAKGRRWSSPLLNAWWCASLLLAYVALPLVDSAAVRMSAAQVLAYAALAGLVAGLLRHGTRT
ncbi:hypothetical protein [Pseudorhodoferax sp. Leaf267]|uniref:hypothetical protein n=1 Tax=Pseudorhodoferax sp. Leaf267 TaxID=1736316 RepID=UPI0006F4B49C|nr:hypothetical protein [Pseudorhodoferax sp. Leaf267]KQP14323.1 hypothetical protein ASF43_16045 [Pseudorhodoferax sp. Leaf267]